MQTLFFGNGLNLLSTNCPSWNELLKSISKYEFDNVIPYTFRYEHLLSSTPYLQYNRFYTKDGLCFLTKDGEQLMTAEITEEKIKKDIADRIQSFETNEIYFKISQLNVNHYLTTNYDNTLIKHHFQHTLSDRFRQEKLYSIRRRYNLNHDGITQYYWPIHGNIDSPKSIMLGLDHYCGSLAKIEEYVKGTYAIDGNNIPSIFNKLSNNVKYDNTSWIDLFFISDIHIIGFGFDFSELDLWWILNRRKRIIREKTSLVKNRIIFYPTDMLSNANRQMFEAFNVEIHDVDTYSKKYIDNYQKQIDNIKSHLSTVGNKNTSI